MMKKVETNRFIKNVTNLKYYFQENKIGILESSLIMCALLSFVLQENPKLEGMFKDAIFLTNEQKKAIIKEMTLKKKLDKPN